MGVLLLVTAFRGTQRARGGRLGGSYALGCCRDFGRPDAGYCGHLRRDGVPVAARHGLWLGSAWTETRAGVRTSARTGCDPRLVLDLLDPLLHGAHAVVVGYCHLRSWHEGSSVRQFRRGRIPCRVCAALDE